MRRPARRTSDRTVGEYGLGFPGHLIRPVAQSFLIAAISGGLFWLVWIYNNSLRDPRYLDGWILAGGMGLQLYFHIARKTTRLSPRSSAHWRKTHILLGYLLIGAFVSHSDFSLPDTSFEWALWTGFVLVTISGVFGTYLSWTLRTKRWIEEDVRYDRIPDRRSELALNAHAVVVNPAPASAPALPTAPYDSWIMDLYTDQLAGFFQGPRNFTAHIFGSHRPLKRLMDEIDNLSRYVDRQNQEKLSAIKELLIEKDRLDFAGVYLGLTKAWLFVHVPVTYSLIVLTVLHVVVVYAYSSGAW